MAQFVMLLSKQELELVGLASKDSGRGAITGMHVYPSGLCVATDGHILGTVRLNGRSDAADFPLRHSLADSQPIPEAGITIPGETVRAAIKALPKRTTLNILQHAALCVGDKLSALHTTNLDTWQEFTWRTEELGTFPSWQHVWPKESLAVETWNPNGHYLTRLGAVLDKVVYPSRGTHIPQPISWRFYGPDNPIEFAVQVPDMDFRGILMPVRMERENETEFGCPSITTTEEAQKGA